MRILDALRGLKLSDEFEAALPKIRDEAEELRATLDTLRASLPSAPFEMSAAEVVALRQRIRDTEDEIATLEGVEEETKRRMNEAFRAEQRADVVGRMSRAKAAETELKKIFGRYDKLLNELDSLLADSSGLVEVIRVENAYAQKLGQHDLMLKCPTDVRPRASHIQALRAETLTPYLS